MDDSEDLELMEQYDLLNTDSEDSRSDHNEDEIEAGLEEEDFEAISADLKAQTVEIISALGGLEETPSSSEDHEIDVTYVIGDDCLRCLRDLRRLWSQGSQDPDRTIARVFAQVGVLQNLIPLLLKTAGTSNERHQKIALACTDLLTSITWPVDAQREVREAAQRGDDTEALGHLFSLESNMISYKAAILRQRSGEVGSKSTTTQDTNVLTSIMRFILLPSLSKPRHQRNERDLGTISMSLHFFRNLLAIRDPIATTLSSAEQISNAGLQSELICAMSKSHILETLLMLANSAESREFAQWNAITAECFFVIYGGESASNIGGDNRQSGSWTSQQRPDNNNATSSNAGNKTTASTSRGSALSSYLNAEAHQKRMSLGNSGSSRHSRFGTTLNFYTSEGDRRVARNAGSLRKTVDELRSDNITKSQRRIRRRRKAREEGAPSVRPEWSLPAKGVLKDLADRLMLSNGFEVLTRSVLNDIRSEREKLGNLDEARIRLMITASFFLDYFMLRRQSAMPLKETSVNASKDKDSKGKGREQADEEQQKQTESSLSAPTWSFSLLSEWLKPWSFKMVFIRSLNALEAKTWLELSASLQLWLSLLNLIDTLSRSDKEVEKDVAEQLQANHFYQSETLDLCVKISRCFINTKQSFEFLQVMIAFMAVMPKMLEKYSTNKEHIFIRAKRQIRKKNKSQDEDDQEEEYIDKRVKNIYTERRFSFESFQNKLCNRPLVEACVTYLGKWRDFPHPRENLSHVVSIMHRIAIKAGDVRSFYPAHIRLCFSTLLKSSLLPAMKPCAPVPIKDVESLIKYVLKKFDKLSAEEKEAWQLGIKPPRKTSQKLPSMPREIQVKPGMSRDDQVFISVGLLIEKGLMSRVVWVKDALEVASAQRMEIVLNVDGKRVLRSLRSNDHDNDTGEQDEGEHPVDDSPATEEEQLAIMEALQDSIPSSDSIAKFPSYRLPLHSDSSDDSTSIAQDSTLLPSLKLLCRLMGLESNEDDPKQWYWQIPSEILPSHLDADVKLIEQSIRHPLEIESGLSFADYIQPVPKKRNGIKSLIPEDYSDGSSSSSEDGNASDLEIAPSERKKGHKRRKDLANDPRKKKGYRKRPAALQDGPLFLQDDMIESDEDEQVEALWRQTHGEQDKRLDGRAASRSESSVSEDERGSSTPPTSPFDHDTILEGKEQEQTPRARPRPRPRSSNALFLASDEEDDGDDQDQNARRRLQTKRKSNALTVDSDDEDQAEGALGSESLTPVAQVQKRESSTLTVDSDDDDDQGTPAAQVQKRKSTILSYDSDDSTVPVPVRKSSALEGDSPDPTSTSASRKRSIVTSSAVSDDELTSHVGMLANMSSIAGMRGKRRMVVVDDDDDDE
ncbi:unnamed protein product [Sympodiomycopsis kandeliae]